MLLQSNSKENNNSHNSKPPHYKRRSTKSNMHMKMPQITSHYWNANQNHTEQLPVMWESGNYKTNKWEKNKCSQEHKETGSLMLCWKECKMVDHIRKWQEGSSQKQKQNCHVTKAYRSPGPPLGILMGIRVSIEWQCCITCLL